MSRNINKGTSKHTLVLSNDVPKFNANHEYIILNNTNNDLMDLLTTIKFQKGPIKESGVNGCHNEDLINIVIDRLECFQRSEFACRENDQAVTKLEEALHWLRHRTDSRSKRGVEGTSKI